VRTIGQLRLDAGLLPRDEYLRTVPREAIAAGRRTGRSTETLFEALDALDQGLSVLLVAARPGLAVMMATQLEDMAERAQVSTQRFSAIASTSSSRPRRADVVLYDHYGHGWVKPRTWLSRRPHDVGSPEATAVEIGLDMLVRGLLAMAGWVR
jgi:hypothetical protein